METDDAQTLREIAATLAVDGYALTAKVLRDIARRMDDSTPAAPRARLSDVDDQQQRLERLRQQRDQLSASGSADERRELDQEIAEAEEDSLVGSGQPRTDTRLEGSQARCYVAAMMRQGPRGVDARSLRRDALTGTRAALGRLRLAATAARQTFAHARVSGPRRPGRVRVARARRGPARAAPARPRRGPRVEARA